ncbi:MAG: sulfoxide reductase heme-binding subunit YedZ [marine benthic group bacterium]|nr:sulfoxide reductase heme-binding subunit YedZ [Candidatus Carthagonibacter metallireducens]MCL7967286.1 sulfoxide reductase heme-binding subunit YedZ [Gemmatimonadota bacterium]MCL7969842.1 sulfoxide reductase heme-binding subunit YedZ [Gemmatimonadota bacterium]MCL7974569.1 sulfoxide reductase heme-binding subunit YedZ [Gemmatimonadota bacterium]
MSLRLRWGKVLVWIVCLLPALWLGYEALTGQLGANPIEEVLHRTGWWALALLMVSLAVTPIRRLTGWNRLIRYRRLLGLFAFAWATTHFLGYLVLDQWFAWPFIVEDITERPFILVGFAAWLLLLPLAVTSTRGWIRRLGKRWGVLHRLVYLAAALGSLHFFWKVKADTREPLVFIAVLAVLLLIRVPRVRDRAGEWRKRLGLRATQSGGTYGARRDEDRLSAPGP